MPLQAAGWALLYANRVHANIRSFVGTQQRTLQPCTSWFSTVHESGGDIFGRWFSEVLKKTLQKTLFENVFYFLFNFGNRQIKSQRLTGVHCCRSYWPATSLTYFCCLLPVHLFEIPGPRLGYTGITFLQNRYYQGDAHLIELILLGLFFFYLFLFFKYK